MLSKETVKQAVVEASINNVIEVSGLHAPQFASADYIGHAHYKVAISAFKVKNK